MDLNSLTRLKKKKKKVFQFVLLLSYNIIAYQFSHAVILTPKRSISAPYIAENSEISNETADSEAIMVLSPSYPLLQETYLLSHFHVSSIQHMQYPLGMKDNFLIRILSG